MGFEKVEAANYSLKISNLSESTWTYRPDCDSRHWILIMIFGLRKTRVFMLYHKALIARCEVCRRFYTISACDGRTWTRPYSVCYARI